MGRSGGYMVFDVESVGLHGPGFAAGWTVVRLGVAGAFDFLSEGTAIAPPPEPVPAWVRDNVLPVLPMATHATLRQIRDEFWRVWTYWRGQGVILAADVPWPVEARFLAACVDDDPQRRDWEGPYPLVDVASVRLAAGLDPLAEVPRLEFEQPAHNPLADARQSARLLMEALCRAG